jgi:hypothetical protein
MDTEALNKNLTQLNKNIERQTSLKFIVIRGIVTGLATVVGASIVAGIVFSVLSNTVGDVENVPLVGDIEFEQ